MATGFAKISVLGHVGQAPKITQLPSGMWAANFSIAVNEDYRKADGTEVKNVHWYRIDALQKGEKGLVTNVVRQYVVPGTLLYVEGFPQQEEYTDKNGNKARSFKIRLGHPGTVLQLCGGPRTGNGAAKAPESAGEDMTSGSTLGKDEIPF